MDVGDPTTLSWIQTGGVLGFAGVVLYELKQLKPMIKEWIEERRKDRELLAEVKTILAQQLERERMRSEQRNALLRRRGDSDQPVPPDWTDITDAVAMPLPGSEPPKRRRTEPGGHPVQSGAYGPIKPPRER